MGILRFSISSFAIVLATAAAVTSWPTVDRASANSIFCTDRYDPVCAVSATGFRRTFSNACWAKTSGARLLHSGVCEGPICPQIVKRVCAIDPVTNRPKTYTNVCWAEIANATAIAYHPCPVKPMVTGENPFPLKKHAK
jgi:hypothetical protein